MTKTKKFLLAAYIQDFLETDFLYFFDANENLMVLPEWGRDKSTRLPTSQMKTLFQNICYNNAQ